MSSARRLLTVYYLDRRGRWQQRGDHLCGGSGLCHDIGAGSDPNEEKEEEEETK